MINLFIFFFILLVILIKWLIFFFVVVNILWIKVWNIWFFVFNLWWNWCIVIDINLVLIKWYNFLGVFLSYLFWFCSLDIIVFVIICFFLFWGIWVILCFCVFIKFNIISVFFFIFVNLVWILVFFCFYWGSCWDFLWIIWRVL